MGCQTTQPTDCKVCKRFAKDNPSRTYSCVKWEIGCKQSSGSWYKLTRHKSIYPTKSSAKLSFEMAIAHSRLSSDCEDWIEGKTDSSGELEITDVQSSFGLDYWECQVRHTHKKEKIYSWDEGACTSKLVAVNAITALRNECLLSTYFECKACGQLTYSPIPNPVTATSNRTVSFSRECRTGTKYTAFTKEESRTGCCYTRTCNC